MAKNNVNERFSIFPCGWWNEAKQEACPQQRPQQTQTIDWVYEYIISERARKPTEELRAMIPTATKAQRDNFKVLNFEYATFSGVFSYRNANCLGVRSPYLCLDIDGLDSGDEARAVQHALCADKHVETELCFVSPSGNGVKWVVRLPEAVEGMCFRDQWYEMRNLLAFNYGLVADPACKDVTRACFLPWDNECFINSKYNVSLI